MTSPDRWRRIEEIFQKALDLSPADRAAFLASACGGDADLRREVESLLARDTEESPAISSIIEGAAAGLLDDAPPDTMSGAELGSYRIIRELGRGGMGAVYLAVRSDRAFEKQVAIKLVKRGIDTDAILRRFWYERQILAALEHPYIARLLDGGTSPDGRPYFVMEYIDGEPLDVYVEEHQLSIVECCRLFRKICEAVTYAHRNLIIHRDLKPANILVTADGSPKLLDFGIARLLSVDPGEQTILGSATSAGQTRAHTPEFASPEQIRGGAVTTDTDVYSLGATLRAILPSPTALPSELSIICNKATREDPGERFASVADFSEDLRRYISGLPILAREQTFFYRAAKFVRRHRGRVALAALAALLLLAGILAIAWESRRADTERKEAERRLSQAVAMAEQTLRDIDTTIALVPGTTEPRRQMVRNTLDYLNRLSQDSGDDPRVLTVLAKAYIRIGQVLGDPGYPNLGDLKGSLATYQKAAGITDLLLRTNPADKKTLALACGAHQALATVFAQIAKHAEAEKEYAAAIAFIDRALALDPNDSDLQYQSVDAHYAFDMFRYTERPGEAEQDARIQLPIAIKLASQRPGDMDLQSTLSELYSLLGITANRQQRLNESLGFYRKAAAVREAIFRQTPRNANVQRNLIMGYGHIGDILGNPFTGCLGDYRGALDYYHKAATLALDLQRADPSDKRAAFDVCMLRTRIGATLQAAGDLKRSNVELDQAITGFESVMATAPGNASYARALAIAYEFRARNAWLLADPSSALVWYRKSLAANERILSARPEDLSARAQQVYVTGAMAALLAQLGDPSAAGLARNTVDQAATLQPIPQAKAWWWYGQTFETLRDRQNAALGYANSAEAWKKVLGFSAVPSYAAQCREAMRKAAATASPQQARPAAHSPRR